MTDRIDTAKVREKMAALEGHTPGPWESSGGLVGSYIEGRHEWSSVALIGHVDVDHESEMHPNEKLIAAAPDLKATVAKLCDALDAKDAEIERLRAERSDFDRADWFWRDLDPDDSGDSAHEAIDMLPDFMVSCVCSSFSGPTRYVFRAPVLGTDSDDTEVLHFDTEEEALAAATARAALNPEDEV